MTATKKTTTAKPDTKPEPPAGINNDDASELLRTLAASGDPLRDNTTTPPTYYQVTEITPTDPPRHGGRAEVTPTGQRADMPTTTS